MFPAHANLIPSELTTSAWQVSLEAYGLIQVSGPDAKTFLQGQLTADINGLTAQKSQFSAYCNPKGRILALLRVFKTAETGYLLRLPQCLLPLIISNLKKYGQFSKIDIQDLSLSISRVGVSHLPLGAEVDDCWLNKGVMISRIPGLIPRYELYAEDRDALNHFLAEYRSQLSTTEFSHWQLVDIRSGIPEVFLASSGLFLAQSLNLPALNAVSFNKGCYCGQEIIARMHYKGSIKRGLYSGYHADWSQALSPGLALYDQNHRQPIATVILSAASLGRGYEILIEGELAQKNFYLANHPEPLLSRP